MIRSLREKIGEHGETRCDSFYHTLREARIDELKEELDRLLSQVSGGAKADSVQRLLQDKNVSSDLKQKLQRLETQKRAALDGEDYAKAAEIKKAVEEPRTNENASTWGDRSDAGSSCIPLSEVARHNKPHDCWVALNGTVYDLTDFLTQHPEQRNAILAWAGRDATAVIPGRFPSANWMDFYMRPEAKMGEVGKEPEVDPKIALIRKLQDEPLGLQVQRIGWIDRMLHKLEGPSQEEIQAAKAATQKVPGTAKEAPTEGEEARFPKLKESGRREITAGKELPFFSRAEVAKHNTAEEPYMIIHNKVYNLKSLMGSHPGGDDILLSKAGTDATQDFEVFEHSEKARVQRDRDMLVGQLLPAEAADWTTGPAAGAGTASASAAGGSEVQRYLRYKAYDLAVGAVAWYLVKTLQNRKPLSQFTYSRALHAQMNSATNTSGTLAHSCRTGLAMMAAILVRIFFRMKSGIPPRFPGHPVVKFLETSSLRLFYALAVLLPVSGMANEYFLKWAPGSETTGKDEDDRRNDRLAKQSIDAHKVLGKFLQYAFLPFHLGYTTLYHYSQGRNIPLSEVNRHCIPEDCWVALNGKVYDLSEPLAGLTPELSLDLNEFMDRHPGGPTTIVAWAGKDASKFFNDIHKGVKIESYLRPESYQGDLGLDESLMSDSRPQEFDEHASRHEDSFYHTLREARIDELKEELDRLLSQVSGGAKADSVQRLLQDKNVSSDLKQKLQRLETQKRAALDGEDYAKAAEIKKAVEERTNEHTSFLQSDPL
eukprot:g20634.t1